jgi:hypothetical protein
MATTQDATRDAHRRDEAMCQGLNLHPWGIANEGPLRLHAIRSVLGRECYATAMSTIASIQMKGLETLALTEPVVLSSGMDAALSSSMIYAATPCYVDPDVAVSLLGTVLPDDVDFDDINLPFPVSLLYFGHPLEIPKEVLDWNDGLGNVMGDRTVSENGWLAGMILLADDDGKPRDEFAWIIMFDNEVEHADNPMYESTAPLRPNQKVYLRTTLRWASREACESLGWLRDNVVAGLAWAPWTDSDPTTELDGLDPDSREFRRTLKRGGVQRRLAKQGAESLRMLDIAAASAPTPPKVSDDDDTIEPSSPGRSVSPHFRRGHVRRVRIGPRDSWEYSHRWIAPTVVQGTAAGAGSETVYRLLPEHRR